jgi:hypothetical protein
VSVEVVREAVRFDELEIECRSGYLKSVFSDAGCEKQRCVELQD